MAEEKINNKIITAILAIFIIIAAVIILYVNLPEETSTNDNDNQENQTEDTIYLTVSYGDEETTYTLDELESLDIITGFGGYRTSFPVIKGQGTYTGVPVTTLVELSAGIISNYTLKVFSDEGGTIENITYDYGAVQGNVDIYNSTNASDETPISNGGVTMIVCYQKDGEYLDESSDGKLKIAFVNQDEELITASSYWWKYVYLIEIIEE